MVNRVCPCLRALLIALALPLVALGACRLSERITKDQAAVLIRESAAFQRPKFVRIPRQITFRRSWSSEYGQEKLLSVSELAQIDPVVAILKLQRAVRVDESVFGAGRGAPHLFVVTPIDIDSASLLVDAAPSTPTDAQAIMDAQQERPYGRRAYGLNEVKRDRGWRMEIGRRVFVRVDDIHNWRDPNIEIPVNELAIDFSWKWESNELGDAFDSRSTTFESLPDSVQEAARSSGIRMNTSDLMHSRAYFHREGAEWKLRVIEWSFGRGNPD